MKLKHPNRWFAAGPEVGRALECLSDGSFRLYLYLCLHASRDSGCLTVNESDLARTLHKSRRSIITYFEELCRQQVCRTAPAVNQHQGGEIEICDAFWPYHKATTPTISPRGSSLCRADSHPADGSPVCADCLHASRAKDGCHSVRQ